MHVSIILHNQAMSIKTLRLSHFHTGIFITQNIKQQSTAALQGYTKMNAKLLTLMAILSLAALAAGFLTHKIDKRNRTDINALWLIGKIAREQGETANGGTITDSM